MVPPNYDIGTPIECKLLSHGLNDTYLVRTAEDRYILRVYRTRWRKGYTERRPLSDLDLAAVRLFVAARHIWLLGLHTGNSQDWGCGWLNDDYSDDGGAGGFRFLREWEAEHLNGEETDI